MTAAEARNIVAEVEERRCQEVLKPDPITSLWINNITAIIKEASEEGERSIIVCTSNYTPKQIDTLTTNLKIRDFKVDWYSDSQLYVIW